jgi:Zn-dependent protease with chaperone function
VPIFLLLLLTVVCLLEKFPAPVPIGGWQPGSFGAAVLTGGAMGCMVLAGWLLANWFRRNLRSWPNKRDHWIRKYSALRFYHLVSVIAVYASVLYFFGWGWAVQNFCLWLSGHDGQTVIASHDWPQSASDLEWLYGRQVITSPVQKPVLLPGAELLLLAPFLTALILSWFFYYDADRALHESSESASEEAFWSRGGYLGYRLRQNLALLFAPLSLMIVVKALQHAFGEGDAGWLSQLIAQAIALALIPPVFIGFPWILRLVLGLKPLPEGTLRERLMATSRRLNFRCSNILLWDTHGGVANAVVAGVVRHPRYVLFTDRLVSDLTPSEVEAVFGHEIGHVKHYHIPYYVGFLLVSICAVACLWNLATLYVPALRSILPPNEEWTKVPFVGVVGAYIFLVFGFLSRRCERQADVFGCRAVSCGRSDCPGHADETVLSPEGAGLCATGIRTFVDALQKVDRINHGAIRGRPGWLQSWQHSTVAHRVAFLQRVLADPSLEQRFQRRVALVKWALALGLALLVSVLIALQGWQAIFSF